MMQSLISSGRSIHHFTSIGDSIYEKVASQSISSKYQIPCTLIQFLPTPTISQLTKQLQILQHHLQSHHSYKDEELSPSIYRSPDSTSEEYQEVLPFSIEVSDDYHCSPVVNFEYEMQIQSPISDGNGEYDDEEETEIIELLHIKRSPSFDSTCTLFS